MATGHYARVAHGRGGAGLMRGADRNKDQSYFLFALSVRQLKRIAFPLGMLHKDAVRAKARELGLPVAERPESQDICLGDHRAVVASLAGPGQLGAGEIVDSRGRVLGRHDGIHHFTVGQRRGLGIAAPRPLYVLRIDADARRVVVGPREELCTEVFTASRINWITPPPEGGDGRGSADPLPFAAGALHAAAFGRSYGRGPPDRPASFRQPRSGRGFLSRRPGARRRLDRQGGRPRRDRCSAGCPRDSRGQPMRVAIKTLGCKINQYDTAVIQERLARESCAVVPFEDPADVYVVNTCTVTDRADWEARQLVRKAKRSNPAARVVVTGCYAQVSPDEVSQVPGVDRVVGLNRMDELVRCVTAGESVAGPAVSVGNPPRRTHRQRPGHPAFFGPHSGVPQGAGRMQLRVQLLHHPHRPRA